MMRVFRLLLTIVSLAAAPALAVADQPAAPATMSNDLKVKFVDQDPADRLASKLIGTDIHNKAGDTIGSIADIVLDPQNKVHAYVVSVGGFLGIGSKYVAVDPSALVLARDKDNKMTASIDTGKDQLKAAPQYRYLADQKTTK